MRVLIVEDEPYLAEAIRDGLRLEAIAADIAGDGDTALELLGVNAYDIAVLDEGQGSGVQTAILSQMSGEPVDEPLLHGLVGYAQSSLCLWGVREQALKVQSTREGGLNGAQ